MAERQFGPYRLVHQIATGGMAEIHLAKTRGIGGFEKYVALKMIHPNFSSDEHFIQMLIDEAKISVQLQHVNIAQIFDLGRVGETFYITMEYVDGCDLYKILRKASEQDRPMPVELAAFVAKEVCTGLDYAHRKRDDGGKPLGIVHRDVSPQNVLVSHAAEVKIVDFGIAKASMRARQTAVGVIKGKYYYMSPEQAWGDPLDHRTDIFSAGILLYEMLTGQMLYLEEDMQKLLDMVRKAEIPPPSARRRGVPHDLERIVMRALQKKPGNRFQSAQDFGAALERFLHVHAPDFTPSRLSGFMAQVLGDAPPPAAAAAEPPPANPARVTRGLGREAIMSRAEFTDENSVIFRMSDLARGPGGRGPAGARAPAPPPVPVAAAEPRRPRPPTRPPLRMQDAATPHVPLPDEPEDATVVSDPPGWAGGAAVAPAFVDAEDEVTPVATPEQLFSRPPVDPAGVDTGDRTGDMTADHSLSRSRGADEDDTTTTGRVKAAPRLDTPPDGVSSDEEPTRLDVGAITPTPERRPAAAEKPFDEDDLLEVPTARLKEAESVVAMAKNPTPAVSAIVAPRPSRRTPIAGVPVVQVPGIHPGVVNAPPGEDPLVLDGSAAPPSGLPLSAPADTPLPGRLPVGPPPPYPTPSEPLVTPTADFSLDDGGAVVLSGGRSPWLWIGLAAVGLAVVIAIIVAASGGEAPPARASLEVISIPPGATVTIDGKPAAGVTPVAIPDLEPGKTYRVRVQLPKYEPWQNDEPVPDGVKQLKVIAPLKPIEGTLHVRSEPAGGEVFLNGRSIGRTPLDAPHLDPFVDGTVEVRLRGHKPSRQPLAWSGQREVTLTFKLQQARD